MEQLENKYKELLDSIYSNEIVLSYSSLKQFYNTPRSFVNYKLKKFEKTNSMIEGSLLDCLILSEENFNNQFVVLDSTPSTDNQKGFANDVINGLSIQDAFSRNYAKGNADLIYQGLFQYIEAIKSGKDCVSSAMLEKTKLIAKSVKENPIAQQFLEQAISIQEKLEWEQEGFKHVGFLDVRGNGFIMDLKYKSQSASIDKFKWDFKDLHYDLQAGMYCKAAQILGLEENPKYYIMVYDALGEVSVIEIERSYVAYGQYKHELILQEFKRCKKENLWKNSHDFYANDGVYLMTKPAYAELKKHIE